MSLDDALRGTLRNFSTFFLVLFMVLGPLHLLYGFAFADVLALRELHPSIAEFPPSRQVRGVGRAALDQARTWLWVVTVLELTLVPVFVRLIGHVRATDDRHEVPTAIGAWRSVRRSAPSPGPSGRSIQTVAAGVVLGVLIGWLTEATLMVVADLVPDNAAFALIALARSMGHSAGGAIALGVVVYAGSASRVTREEAPDLY